MKIRRTNWDQMQLEKLLHEFPWLWSAHTQWRGFNEFVFIETARIDTLKQTRATLGFDDMWVKSRDAYCGTSVTQVSFLGRHSWYQNLAGYALNLTERSGHEIEAILAVKRRREVGCTLSFFTIYREKKNGKLHQLCLEAVKGMTKTQPPSSDMLLMMDDP